MQTRLCKRRTDRQTDGQTDEWTDNMRHNILSGKWDLSFLLYLSFVVICLMWPGPNFPSTIIYLLLLPDIYWELAHYFWLGTLHSKSKILPISKGKNWQVSLTNQNSFDILHFWYFSAIRIGVVIRSKRQ